MCNILQYYHSVHKNKTITLLLNIIIINTNTNNNDDGRITRTYRCRRRPM